MVEQWGEVRVIAVKTTLCTCDEQLCTETCVLQETYHMIK